MRELALFAGGGGGILGGYLLGWETVCAVEIERYPRDIFLERQRDGILPRFPIWDDITTFDGQPWKGRVDIVSGGFPCQDISSAGKGKGITGEKSGLWKEMSRIIHEVRPRFAFMENSPMLTSRGLGIVLGDLAEMGYNARWCVLGADDAGAPHQRKRIWILAYSSRKSRKEPKETKRPARDRTGNKSEAMADSNKIGREKRSIKESTVNPPGGTGLDRSGIDWWKIDPADLPDTNQFYDNMGGYGASKVQQSEETEVPGCEISDTTKKGFQDRRKEKIITGPAKELERFLRNREDWPIKSRMGRVAHGVASRVDRLKTIGNGQVPAVAALAFIILSEGLV